MHLPACGLAQTLCVKSCTENRNRGFGSVVRNETGTRVAIHSAQLVGSNCLPEATSNIRRRK